MRDEFGTFGASGQTVVIEDDEAFERGYATGPERALMSALLFDGVQACINYAMSGTGSTKAQYKEAFNWIHKRGDGYVFSFESCCEALGICPDGLRFGIANFVSSHSVDYKRSRRNF